MAAKTRNPLLLVLAIAMATRNQVSAAECKSKTTSRLKANKRVVLDFWRTVIEARDLSHLGDYMTRDMVQHTPTMADGIAGFAAYSPNFWKGESKRPVELVLRNPPAMVLADGDMVQLVFRRQTPDPTTPGMTYDRYTFDLYRVAGGKIVEHWDNVIKPPPSTYAK